MGEDEVTGHSRPIKLTHRLPDQRETKGGREVSGGQREEHIGTAVI